MPLTQNCGLNTEHHPEEIKDQISVTALSIGLVKDALALIQMRCPFWVPQRRPTLLAVNENTSALKSARCCPQTLHITGL